LNKKTVLVTGSSRGIGKAIALKFARKGYNVIINASKSFNELMSTKEAIENLGAKCYPVMCDVSNFQEVAQMYEEVMLSFPKIDVIINNAGISKIGLFTDMDFYEWNKIIQTNINSVFNVCHHFVPHMISNKSGHILNISSIWGLVGASCEVAYSTTKGAINSFTKALAKELGPSNIYVNAIACGAIDTEMNSFLSDEERKDFENDIALCRFGTPNEVANLAYFLCSKEASYLTGEVVKLDGGTL